MNKIPSGTVVVIAEQGAGKSRAAPQLAALLGCTHVIDEWDGVAPLPANALVLTNAPRVAVSWRDELPRSE
jgi:hypothetical protein